MLFGYLLIRLISGFTFSHDFTMRWFLSVLMFSAVLLRESLSGFTSGAPCSIRNTAYLETIGFWKFPKQEVQCLDISAVKKLIKIPKSVKFINATTLYGDHINLQRLPQRFLKSTPNLSMIDFSSNNLHKLHKNAFSSHRNLRILLLAENYISIPQKYPLLSSKSLGTLSLSSNRIKKLRLNTFTELEELTVLYLDNNLLVKLHHRIFKPLKKLKFLHLGNNHLMTVPYIFLGNPKSITILDGNPINGTVVIR